MLWGICSPTEAVYQDLWAKYQSIPSKENWGLHIHIIVQQPVGSSWTTLGRQEQKRNQHSKYSEEFQSTASLSGGQKIGQSPLRRPHLQRA